MTKNFATVSLAVLSLFAVSSANAADVFGSGSTKDGPIVSSGGGMVNWTGPYFGGHVGYGISSGELTKRSTEDFAATPSSCWTRGSWSSTNKPTTDPQNFPTLSNDFDLNISKDGVDNDTLTDVGVQLPAYGQNAVDPDPRVHDVNVGASVTNITAEECRDIREDIGLINAAGADNFPNITSGYDPAVDAHSVTTVTNHKTSDAGIIGGARVGYDRALGRFLIGAFGDYNFSEIEGLDSQWLVAGRAGIIVAPRTLLYGLVGYGQSNYDDADFSGVVAGAGIEFAVSSNFYLGLEYQHAFYGDENIVNTPNLKIDASREEDRILATAKFKLNGGFSD
jgi:opacity protein-like surface antigen